MTGPSPWLAAALAVAVVAFLGVRMRTIASGGPSRWALAAILDPTVTAALCGGLLGFAAPGWIGRPMDLLQSPALVFFAGWIGVVAGCGLDLRVVHRDSAVTFVYEGAGAAVAVIGWLVVTSVAGNALPGVPDLGAPAALFLAALCLTGPALPASSAGSGRGPGRSGGGARGGFWIPSALAALAVLTVAVGAGVGPGTPFHLSLTGEQSTPLQIDSLPARLLWGVVAGCLTGLLADLATRHDFAPGGLYPQLAAVVLLCVGIAGSVGLEPMLVGLVAGFWLINATLRRLDILQVLERGAVLPRLGVPFLAAWMVGSSLPAAGFDVGVFAAVAVAVCALRPAVRIATGRAVQRASRSRRRGSPHPAGWIHIDELGLLIGVLLTRVLEPAAGTAALAGVLAALVVLGSVRRWWAQRDPEPAPTVG